MGHSRERSQPLDPTGFTETLAVNMRQRMFGRIIREPMKYRFVTGAPLKCQLQVGHRIVNEFAFEKDALWYPPITKAVDNGTSPVDFDSSNAVRMMPNNGERTGV